MEIRAFPKVLGLPDRASLVPLGAWITRGLGWCQAKPHPCSPPDPGPDGGPLGCLVGVKPMAWANQASENPAWVNPVLETPISANTFPKTNKGKPVRGNQLRATGSWCPLGCSGLPLWGGVGLLLAAF